MSTSLLSLPNELLMRIAFFVLVSPGTLRIHISPCSERFTYVNSPSQITSSKASKHSAADESSAILPQSEGMSLELLRKLPEPPPAPTRAKFPRSPSTRSRTLALLPQRPCNPHQSCTAISLLLVNRRLRAIGTSIYYSNHIWDIGIHNRTPKIPTFRSFLDAIGPLARSCIRSIIVLSRFGYSCLWKSLSSGWITQLRRCQGLKKVLVLMTPRWAKTLEARCDTWSEYCTTVWRKKGLEAVTEVGALPLWSQTFAEEVNTWSPVEEISVALDQAFCKFRNVKSLEDD